jgi:hypothetical protein
VHPAQVEHVRIQQSAEFFSVSVATRPQYQFEILFELLGASA